MLMAADVAGLIGAGRYERLNDEIKHRTNRVGIVPNEAAAPRLVSELLPNRSGEWDTQRGRTMALEGICTVSDTALGKLSAMPA